MCLEHAKSSKETRLSRLRESEGKLHHCCLSTLSQLSGNYFNPKELQSFKEHCCQKNIPVHCPWRYFCESFLLCFATCYLEVNSPYLLFVCKSGPNGKKKFKRYTVQDLVSKMTKLRQKYKQEKDNSSRSGTGKRKKWKFFEIIDRTLCDISPSVSPRCRSVSLHNRCDSSCFDVSHTLLLRCDAR